MKALFFLFHDKPFSFTLHEADIPQTDFYTAVRVRGQLPPGTLHIEDTRLNDICEITVDEVRIGIVVFSDD